MDTSVIIDTSFIIDTSVIIDTSFIKKHYYNNKINILRNYSTKFIVYYLNLFSKNGKINLIQFRKMLDFIVPSTKEYPQTDEQKQFWDTLFTIYTPFGEIEIDIFDMMGGLSLLTKNSISNRLLPVFYYIKNANNKYTYKQLSNYLISIFRMQYILDPNSIHTLGVTSQELALLTAEEIFKDNRDGFIYINDILEFATPDTSIYTQHSI